jgi:hypothetical protein
MSVLTGTWTTEGSHPLLPDVAIRGRAEFEWLDGEKFLIWRSQYDHPEIPDAISLIGVTGDRLSMHYFDTRGVHRVYSVGMSPGTWHFEREDPGFAQRFTGTFDDTGDTITGHGQLSRDGLTWEDDLALTYRRTRRGPAGGS